MVRVFMRYLAQLKWDLGVVFILGGVSFFFLFGNFSWVIQADNPAEYGSRPPDRFVGDILLLLPSVPADHANVFEELDSSYAWYNALWQRFGSFGTAKLNAISPELLAGRLAIIVPESVSKAMNTKGLQALRVAAETGAHLLVEMPSNAWSELTGLTRMGSMRNATYAQLASEYGDVEIPLLGERIPLKQKRTIQFEHSFVVDGEPGLLTRKIGKGRITTLSFQAARNFIALQQGVPTQGMYFDSEATKVGSRSKLSDIERASPLSDILENSIFEVFGKYRPTPRIWSFPTHFLGALTVIYPINDAKYFGRNLKPGVLIKPRFNKEGRDKSVSDYCMWSTTFPDDFKQSYLNFWNLPIFKEISLEEQVQDCSVVIAKHMQWSPLWIEDIGKLAANGILADLSMGPLAGEKEGYAFGTGFPFFPIDQQGLPLPVLLLPMLFTDASQLTSLEKFIVASKKYHQIIGVSFPTDEMKNRPDASSLLTLTHVEGLAKKHMHWLATPKEILDFLSARRRTILTSQWFSEHQRLVISVNLAKTENLMMSVSIPRSFSGSSIESIVVDGKIKNLKILKHVENEMLLELPAGRHTIEVRYPIIETLEQDDVKDGKDARK